MYTRLVLLWELQPSVNESISSVLDTMMILIMMSIMKYHVNCQTGLPPQLPCMHWCGYIVDLTGYIVDLNGYIADLIGYIVPPLDTL